MGNRCLTCDNAVLAEIEAALAAGRSIRATAGAFGISRHSLARHVGAGHSSTARGQDRESDQGVSGGPPPTLPDGLRSRDPTERFRAAHEAAMGALERAKRLPEALAAAAGVRSASRALDRWGREALRNPPASGEELERIERQYGQAVALLESALGLGRVELEALSGLRSAMADLRESVEAASERIRVIISSHDGKFWHETTWPARGLPPEYRRGAHEIRLHWPTLPFGDYVEEQPPPSTNGHGHTGSGR